MADRVGSNQFETSPSSDLAGVGDAADLNHL